MMRDPHEHEVVAIVLMDLRDDVRLAFNVFADLLVEIGAVELSRVGQRSCAYARRPLVIDTDDDVAAGRPVRHRDSIFDELDTVFGVSKVDGCFEIQVSFLSSRQQLAQLLRIGVPIRDDHLVPGHGESYAVVPQRAALTPAS